MKTAVTNAAPAAPKTPSAFSHFAANWRQNIIYFGFCAIFVIFSLTLSEQGFLDVNNRHDRHHGHRHDFCAVCG